MTQAKPKQVLFTAEQPPMILASSSPRRKELLACLGLQFEVIRPEVDEKALADNTLKPQEYVLKLAQAKGQVVAVNYPNHLVIAADTIVVLDNEIIEKPVDKPDAVLMLKKLQGSQHTVFTAISAHYKNKNIANYCETNVWLATLDEQTIVNYVETEEPLDKAGAYAVQGLAGCFVEKIEGCYSNVVGLSLPLLRQLVGQLIRA